MSRKNSLLATLHNSWVLEFMGNANQPLPAPTWESLRARFKQLQQQTNNVYQNWQIRVHRSLSWYKRALTIAEDQPETRFLLLWIALNCLYSQWDGERNAPAQDASSRQTFLRRLCEWDIAMVE